MSSNVPMETEDELLDLVGPANAAAQAPVLLQQVRRRIRLLLTMGLAIGLALVLTAVLLTLDGQSARDALESSVNGALGSWPNFGTTINRAVPFALAGLGFVVASRAGLFNIGAEGQIYVGAAAAAAVALKVGPTIGGPLGISLAIVMAAGAGACISLLAAVLYLKRNVSVILSTLLLNFVGIQFVSYLVRTPALLQESGLVTDVGDGFSAATRRFPQSDLLANDLRLPEALPGSGAHLGFVVMFLVLAVVVALFRWTGLGFQIRLLGASSDAAEYAGVRVGRTVVLAMGMSGALGGVGGAVIVLGDRYRLLEAVSDGYGFIGILAAMLARYSPVGTVVAALFFACLQRGGQVMEAAGHAPQVTVLIVQGVAVLLIAAAVEFDRRRDIVRTRRAAG